MALLSCAQVALTGELCLEGVDSKTAGSSKICAGSCLAHHFHPKSLLYFSCDINVHYCSEAPSGRLSSSTKYFERKKELYHHDMAKTSDKTVVTFFANKKIYIIKMRNHNKLYMLMTCKIKQYIK